MGERTDWNRDGGLHRRKPGRQAQIYRYIIAPPALRAPLRIDPAQNSRILTGVFHGLRDECAEAADAHFSLPVTGPRGYGECRKAGAEQFACMGADIVQQLLGSSSEASCRLSSVRTDRRLFAALSASALWTACRSGVADVRYRIRHRARQSAAQPRRQPRPPQRPGGTAGSHRA